jgi:pre-mRNA-splicing factor SYF2
VKIMAPPSKKRRISPHQEESTVVNLMDQIPSQQEGSKPQTILGNSSVSKNPAVQSDAEENTASDVSNDRMARFNALRSRATASARSNLAETKAEANRVAMDPSLLANLSRRSAIASHNLLKVDTEEEGGKGAFERKRAWDYTIEESEKWDKRMEKKQGARDNNSFQDYSAEAGKIYERQIRELEKAAAKDGSKHREEYEKQKQEIIETAARSGGLEIVQMENGELVAIDKEGRFFADKDNTGFAEQKPKKENVDRLVEDLRKAEEIRLKKRKERGRDIDEGDVTYINDKNKQFNLKLARFYDRYTTDIRESFERGTAI